MANKGVDRVQSRMPKDFLRHVDIRVITTFALVAFKCVELEREVKHIHGRGE